MAQDLPRVVSFPGFAGSLGGELLVEADEQVNQLAAHGPGAEQVRQLRQVDKPLRIPRSPVIVGPVDDPEDLVVSLACLMQQAADLLWCACYLVPPRIEDGGALWPPRRGRCWRHQCHHGRSAQAAASA